jgi:hypothetical protein
MRAWIVSLAAVSMAGLLALAGGCRSSSAGAVMKQYTPGVAPYVGIVQEDGQYELFAAGRKTPLKSYLLKQGDPLGFEDPDGQLVSLAGTHRDPLATGSYQWKRK